MPWKHFIFIFTVLLPCSCSFSYSGVVLFCPQKDNWNWQPWTDWHSCLFTNMTNYKICFKSFLLFQKHFAKCSFDHGRSKKKSENWNTTWQWHASDLEQTIVVHNIWYITASKCLAMSSHYKWYAKTRSEWLKTKFNILQKYFHT